MGKWYNKIKKKKVYESIFEIKNVFNWDHLTKSWGFDYIIYKVNSTLIKIDTSVRAATTLMKIIATYRTFHMAMLVVHLHHHPFRDFKSHEFYSTHLWWQHMLRCVGWFLGPKPCYYVITENHKNKLMFNLIVGTI